MEAKAGINVRCQGEEEGPLRGAASCEYSAKRNGNHWRHHELLEDSIWNLFSEELLLTQ